jgi:hypothetical protein
MRKLSSLPLYQRLFTNKSSELQKALKEQNYLNKMRDLVKKADLEASNNPDMLRAMAVSILEFYNEMTRIYNQDQRAAFFAKSPYPHPIDRVHYLNQKADELEAEQKLAAQKLQQEQEHYLMLSN